MPRIAPQAQILKDTAAKATGFPKSFFMARTSTSRRGGYTTYGDAGMSLNVKAVVNAGHSTREVHEALADHADDFAREHLTVHVNHPSDPAGHRTVWVSSIHNPGQKVAEFHKNQETGQYERHIRDIFHDRRE